MQIKFIGVPGEAHESIYMYGYDMPLGKYVEVKDKMAVRKLMNHPHFHAKVEEITDVEDKNAVKELQVLVAAAVEPIEASKETDHGNAQPVGDASAAEAPSAGSERSTRRGRPPKSR